MSKIITHEEALLIIGPEALALCKGPVRAVGSRVTCKPAPTNTDADYLVLIDEADWVRLADCLQECDFAMDGSLPIDEKPWNVEHHFRSYKLAETNVVATDSEVFHRRFLAASSIATRLNLLDKPDRIALFQAVLYGNECQPEHEMPWEKAA